MWSPAMTSSAHPRRGGFTIVELLAVITILAILGGLTVPVLNRVITSSSETMADSALTTAVSGTRNYATRYIPFTNGSGGRTAELSGDGYSGAALIVTPANELRLSENDELAVDTFDNRMELPDPGTPIRNAYKPIRGVDDLIFPRGVVMLGIARTGADELVLIPAPFAIAFNRRGELVTQDLSLTAALDNVGSVRRLKRSNGYVYYDGDGSGQIDPTKNLWETPVDLSDFTREAAARLDPAPDPITGELSDFEGRREVPYELLPTVAGVAIFSEDRLPAEYLGSDEADAANGLYVPGSSRLIQIDVGNTDDNLLRWINEGGGRVIFFNRFTGQDLLS